MTKFLQRIWKDISKGENLDAYLIIAAAIVLSGLSIFGYDNPEAFSGVILAILTLVTISTLVSRHQIEDLIEKVSPSVTSTFQDEFPDSLLEDVETSSELWLIGASLDDFLGKYYSTFERKLRQGHTIRVLVMNPENSQILEISDMRAYANPSAARARQKTLLSLDDFCALRRTAWGNLQIRVIDFPISQRMIVASPNSPKGKIYVANYPYQTPGGSLPKFLVKASESKWFAHFRQEAFNLWEAGREWPCQQNALEDETSTEHQ